MTHEEAIRQLQDIVDGSNIQNHNAEAVEHAINVLSQIIQNNRLSMKYRFILYYDIIIGGESFCQVDITGLNVETGIHILHNILMNIMLQRHDFTTEIYYKMGSIRYEEIPATT